MEIPRRTPGRARDESRARRQGQRGHARASCSRTADRCGGASPVSQLQQRRRHRARRPGVAPSPAPLRHLRLASGGGRGARSDIGDFKEVAGHRVMVKAGDAVKVEQSPITVESDKASMEIRRRTPASSGGARRALATRSAGQRRRAGRSAGTAGAPPRRSPPPALRPPRPSSWPRPRRPASGPCRRPPCRSTSRPAPKGRLPHASPSIRKLARELGVPLTR